MKKIIIILSAVLLISIFYYFFINQYLILAFDTFMDFTDRTYNSRLRDEYKTKDYNSLIREIKYNRMNIGRFGNAASVLLDRNERRSINDIAKAFLDMRREDAIRSAAAFTLAKFGGEKASSTLLSVVNRYKEKKYNMSNKLDSKELDQYFMALEALSYMQNEEIYPLALKSARKENKLEKGYTTISLLCYFKNHWQEILPIYLEILKEDPSRGISYLKKLGRPEAIPAIKEAIKGDPTVQREAEEAIKYLEDLKNKQ